MSHYSFLAHVSLGLQNYHNGADYCNVNASMSKDTLSKKYLAKNTLFAAYILGLFL